MARTIAIGVQSFEAIRKNNYFYVDKTGFIKEWWEKGDDVTLINRPRRFGKTLTMNMLDCFFSADYKDNGNLFEGLKIWNEEKYRQLQGTYPVISLSFANIKENNFNDLMTNIIRVIANEYEKHRYLLDGDLLSDNEKKIFDSLNPMMGVVELKLSINYLSNFMSRYYGKKVIILLDEYDTPMQEAYLNGYWDDAVQLFRGFFNATFKTNPYMERAIITGITRISKESIFSDLNNLKVITTTSEDYETVFGFTQDEVFAAMDEYGMDSKDEMKRWYDGFTFGKASDIYNPWSVTNAIRERRYRSYWVNSSSNKLMNSLVKKGNATLKMQFEDLINGKGIECYIDEEIIYDQLDTNKDAVWSFMLAAGYLKVVKYELVGKFNRGFYTLALSNLEVEGMVNSLVEGWFKSDNSTYYNDFVKALLIDDVESMNEFMNEIALNSFSSFDVSKNASGKDAPERFYHGFVLGLMVELDGRYEIKSNRESGFGRYDIMLVPKDTESDKAYIIEFKVKKQRENSLEETLRSAHIQIEEKCYEQELLNVGIPQGNIRKYGFAFEGKTVLIG
jgi:hypothetical protein